MADTSSMGGNSIDSFFSRIVSFAEGANRTYSAIRPIWTGSTAQDTSGNVQNQPTYAGPPGTVATTAGVAPTETQSPNMMPYLLIGGAVLIFLLLKK